MASLIAMKRKAKKKGLHLEKRTVQGEKRYVLKKDGAIRATCVTLSDISNEIDKVQV